MSNRGANILATMKTRDVLRALGQKGFVPSQTDHAYMVLYVNGKESPIRTRVSHGSDEINDYLIHLMCRQLWLDKKKFMELIDCPLSFPDYLKELEGQGFKLT